MTQAPPVINGIGFIWLEVLQQRHLLHSGDESRQQRRHSSGPFNYRALGQIHFHTPSLAPVVNCYPVNLEDNVGSQLQYTGSSFVLLTIVSATDTHASNICWACCWHDSMVVFA